MKTKFNIVFITSIILGFWYVAGRSYFDGLLNTTGFNPAHIGMEVSDYTYFGFLHSYPHLLITGFISSALYLIYEAFKRKNIFLTEFYFCLAKINHIFLKKGITFNEVKTRNEISNKILKNNLEPKTIKFTSILMVWYTFIAFYPLILLGFLYYLINFYNLGEISRNERVLNGESYIIKDNEKYFGIVCGKENCIFQTKDFSKNLSLKDNSIKNNKLQPTKTYNLTNQNSIFSAFEIEQVKNKNYIIYLYQITPKQDLNKNDLKDHLSLFSKKGVVYRPIVNQKVILLNSLSDKPNLPVFLAFKLPLNDQVDFIFNHKIPYKLSLKN